jgi:Protein of unknown function (DUF3574)
MLRRLPIRPLLVSLALAGCMPAMPAAAPVPAPAAREAWVSDRMYFGRCIPGGGTVSDEEWAAFLREVVTPRFPDGLTVLHGEGQWRDSLGAVVGEPTVVVEILHPADGRSDAALEEIAAEYKRRFRQESVMRVRAPAVVEFFE